MNVYPVHIPTYVTQKRWGTFYPQTDTIMYLPVSRIVEHPNQANLDGVSASQK